MWIADSWKEVPKYGRNLEMADVKERHEWQWNSNSSSNKFVNTNSKTFETQIWACTPFRKPALTACDRASKNECRLAPADAQMVHAFATFQL